MTAFEVRVEVFHGPLDLLLTLVRRESIDITSVSLASVTGQFLSYLRRLEEIDVGALASFCEVAASLMLIKSRTLLPRERERALAGDDDEDPDELAARLAAYKHYRDVAGKLGRREQEGLRAFVRVAPPPEALPPTIEPGAADADLLAVAMRDALARLPDPDEAVDPSVQPHKVRIADRLGSIRRRLLKEGRVSFVDVLSDGPRTREFVIVSFLAVLELLRRAAVRVAQDGLFGEIVVEVRSAEALRSLDEGAMPTFFDEP